MLLMATGVSLVVGSLLGLVLAALLTSISENDRMVDETMAEIATGRSSRPALGVRPQ